MSPHIHLTDDDTHTGDANQRLFSYPVPSPKETHHDETPSGYVMDVTDGDNTAQ